MTRSKRIVRIAIRTLVGYGRVDKVSWPWSKVFLEDLGEQKETRIDKLQMDRVLVTKVLT